MIYLIESPGMSIDKDGNKNYYSILKIGYANDKNNKNRLIDYRTENPDRVVIKTILGGTERHEKALHKKFNHLKYSKGKEWFIYSQEILDYFETATLDDLNKLDLKLVERKGLLESNKEIVKKIEQLLNEVQASSKIKFSKEKIKNYRYSIDYDAVLEDICRIYGKDLILSNLEEFREEVKKEKENGLAPIYKSFLVDFNSVNFFTEKMRVCCSYYINYPQLFSEYEKLLYFDIPTNYTNYLNLLGPEKISSLNYQESDILNFIQSEKNRLSGRDDIIKLFEVGKRYTLKDIKERLTSIYNSLGVSKSPKATDLLEYFNLKECLVSIDGKKSRGYEILGLLEN